MIKNSILFWHMKLIMKLGIIITIRVIYYAGLSLSARYFESNSNDSRSGWVLTYMLGSSPMILRICCKVTINGTINIYSNSNHRKLYYFMILKENWKPFNKTFVNKTFVKSGKCFTMSYAWFIRFQ